MKRKILALIAGLTATAATAQVGLVADINPGAATGNPLSLTVSQNRFYFVANDGSHGYELFAFDGSNSPVRLTDLAPGAADGVFGIEGSLGVVDNRVFFAGNNGSQGYELYSYDAAANAHQLVADIEPGAGESKPYYFFTLGNVLYFSAQTAAAGRELFSYDPATNTVALHDIIPGAISSEPGPFVSYNGRLYFGAETASAGRELCYYDPVTNTTGIAADIAPGNAGSAPLSFVATGGKLYFTATTVANGRELYSYDGTAATRLTDFVPGAGNGILNISNNLAAYAGRLYFPGTLIGGNNLQNYQLLSYDPATGLHRTVPGRNGRTVRSPYFFVVNAGLLYFSGYDSTAGQELHVLQNDSTQVAVDINPGSADSYPSQLTVWNGRIFMRASRPANGAELFGFPYTNTGIENKLSSGGVRAFPNPARQELRLRFTSATTGLVSAAVSDLNGRVVAQAAERRVKAGDIVEILLPVTGFAPGVYSYQLISGEGRHRESGLFMKE